MRLSRPEVISTGSSREREKDVRRVRPVPDALQYALNELDHELEKRGTPICEMGGRFFICENRNAPSSIMEGVTKYLEGL